MSVKPDVVLINPRSRKMVYQGLGSDLAAIENPVWAGLMATYVRKQGLSAEIIDAEAEELDMDTLLAQGPLVVEWPEHVEPVLPAERLWAWLEYESEEHRAMRFAACGDRYKALLDDLRRELYGVD